jgi:hypothetical protein
VVRLTWTAVVAVAAAAVVLNGVIVITTLSLAFGHFLTIINLIIKVTRAWHSMINMTRANILDSSEVTAMHQLSNYRQKKKNNFKTKSYVKVKRNKNGMHHSAHFRIECSTLR